MRAQAGTRACAVLACLLVAGIWGSSLVLAKQTLTRVEPLTLAGLRYFLGSVIVLPFAPHGHQRRRRSRKLWAQLAVIGVLSYGIGNTALFAALRYVPATTGSFALGLLPMVVLLAGWVCLSESPSRQQLCGVAAAIVGVGLFFSSGLRAGSWLGIMWLAVGVAGNAVRSIVGRDLSRQYQVGALELTAYPLAIGGATTLIAALLVEGLPLLSVGGWCAVLWLAAVNTALAYILFNYALRLLQAFEVNVLLNLTPFVTAGLAWTFLGEIPNLGQILGLGVVVGGSVLVHGRADWISAVRSLKGGNYRVTAGI